MRWTFLALLGCAGGSKSGSDSATDGGASDGDLLELQELISGYESWPQTQTGIVEGSTVHGAFIQTWWNEAAHAAATSDAEAMPDGAVVVKQGYDDADGASLANLTVMWKQSGGAWYYASFDPAGETLQSGQPSGCTDCHDGAPKDQIFSWP